MLPVDRLPVRPLNPWRSSGDPISSSRTPRTSSRIEKKMWNRHISGPPPLPLRVEGGKSDLRWLAQKCRVIGSLVVISRNRPLALSSLNTAALAI